MVEYLLRTEGSERIRATIEDPEVSLHTAALCGVEVASALRRALLARRMEEERARQALTDWVDLPIDRHDHEPLLERILELRHNFSAYDAAYAALAEVLGAELLSADTPFRTAAGDHLTIRTVPA